MAGSLEWLGAPQRRRVKAVLGPTNTGKTHLAIERLLSHHSGIIGFPLRLLARENYDRMVAVKGARLVALITGEEKIVPPEARYFSCTVEAMPLDREAEFVAVDEIQLCADPDRGHVFTDRLLHARGLVETLLLGAETMRPLLARLVPGVVVETRPRLSQLSFIGGAKLSRLPPRSAVVAFSAGEVYAIAELIRRRRGGCAVVMGRLSPRTRNAQVALYQNKEVDYLVATDAIGMGLNMDVNHVGFAGLAKFDGRNARRLQAAELAQIAGRAGRGMRDGTFGTTATCPALPEDLASAIEAHRFDPVEHIAWRNNELDLTSPEALLASLLRPPPQPGLVCGREASDLRTLSQLVRDPDIRAQATGRAATRLLWEACQIPDFRKLGDDSHTRLCARIFGYVTRDGRIAGDWMASQIAALARPEGDIDTLMQRLSGIRVCSYLAARADWLADAPHWQARAREVEDLLSDALHERLTARFVDRRAALLIRRLDDSEGEELLSAVTRTGEVIVEGHAVGHVGGFRFLPDPLAEGAEKRLVLRAARRALGHEMPRRVALLAQDEDAVFGLLETAAITWREVPVARLRRGERLLRPLIEVLESEFLDGAQRERIRARLQLWLDRHCALLLAPLHHAAAASCDDPSVRGLAHRLLEEAGVVRDAWPAHLAGLQPDGLPPVGGREALQRQKLKRLGIQVGRHAVFMPALLKPRAARLRAILIAVQSGRPLPRLPGPSQTSLVRQPPAPDEAALLLRLGWVRAGPAWLRLDVAEQVAGDLSRATRHRPAALPNGIGARLSLPAALLPEVLQALGVRLRPAQALTDGQFGPPAPVMISMPNQLRRASAPVRRPLRAKLPRPEVVDGPFAALEALRAKL